MVENPVESSSGIAPPPMGDLEFETLQSEPAVRAHTDIRLWPSTLRGVILYLLAAAAAITVGVIPALWINVWRHEAHAAEPAASAPNDPAGVAAPHIEPIEAAAAPSPERGAEPPSTEPATVAPMAAPTATVASKPARAKVKPSRAKSQRVKPPPRTPKKIPPPCDIYLHPHGCPK